MATNRGMPEYCAKCGSRHFSTKWDDVFDELRHQCARCSFQWLTEPLTKSEPRDLPAVGKSDG